MIITIGKFSILLILLGISLIPIAMLLYHINIAYKKKVKQ